MSGPPFVELEGVWKSFDEKPVLRGVDLRIEQGECYTLLGGSGSGKSVMLKHMIGLLRPDRGRISVLGQEVSDWRERDWIELRTQLGFVFQGAALFDSLNVRENIAYPIREHRRWDETRVRQRVAECLEAVGLSGIEESLPAELSGGMRKRVGVARAIALEPRAILYDEPTTGLDPANSRRVGEMIADLRRRLSVTSVIVTHDLPLCFAVSDRIGLLREGSIHVEDSADGIRRSGDPVVQDFIAGSPAAPAPRSAGGGAIHGP